MTTLRHRLAWTAAALIPASVVAQVQAPIFFVKANASGANTGLNWQDAFTSLAQALDMVPVNSTLFVASGTYRPHRLSVPTDPRSASFELENVSMYGGFAGNEPNLDQRAGLFAQTILEGDLSVAGSIVDNAYNVVKTRNAVVLDGFTCATAMPTALVPHKSRAAASSVC